ncbi:hypothetical protein [Herbidospora mongoliensis]|uniref:hypothetical protein n=1 Tax=Herbidospora mongoliensis TaxID=688067 RepID=UPI0008341B6B|nr:hypothetical protein [Herbidospora mongoliensis]
MTVDLIGWDTAQRRGFGRLTARSWSDAGFRLRYEREPAAVLAEYDIHLADGALAPALPARPAAEVVVETFSEAPTAPPPCLSSFCFYTMGVTAR